MNTFHWQPIETAPEDENMWLEVTGSGGEIYSLPFPCTRKGEDYFTEKGTKLLVTPVHWRLHYARRVALNPRYAKTNAPR